MAERKLIATGFVSAMDGLLTDMRKKAGANAFGKKAETQENPPTSHPTGSTDNGTQAVQTGQRYSENSSLVKEDIPNSVDGGEEGVIAKGAPDAQQFDIGLKNTVTGNDSENESPKEDKTEDPGTSHPASASRNDKYGSVNFKQASEIIDRLGNEILAEITVKTTKQAAQGSATKPAAPTAQPAPATTKVAALAAQEKQARDEHLALLSQMAKNAELAADLVCRELFSKAAEEASKEVDDAAGEESVGSGEEDKPEDSEGGKDETTVGDVPGGEDALASMLGGGGGASPDAVAGGDPAMGGMSDMGAGGPPPDMGGGDPAMGGQPSPEELIEALTQVLAERGIDPAQLQQLLAGADGGGDPGMGAGGPPPDMGMPAPEMGGGAPPMDPAAMGGPPKMAALKQKRANLRKAASDVIQYKKSGKFRFRPVKTAKEYQLREMLHDFLTEVLPG